MGPKAQTKRPCDTTPKNPHPKSKVQKTGTGSTGPAKAETPAASICGPILDEIHNAMEVIKGHHIFTAIETQLPLPINEGGQQAVFNQSECTLVLEDSKRRYHCAGNFF